MRSERKNYNKKIKNVENKTMKRRKAKKYWIIASVSAVVVTIVGLVAFGLLQTQLFPKEPTKLETPKNFEYVLNVTNKNKTEHLLSWEITNHATGYKITVKGETDETPIEKEVDKHTQEYNIAEYVTSGEDYTVSLTILGDEEKYLTSDPTEIAFKAETATKGLSYERLKDGYEVLRGDAGYSSNLVMPDTYDGESIIKIADNAFGAFMSSDLAMKSVRFPSGLQDLGEFAFANCTYLDNVILPETATQIGAQAFAYCESLKEIIFPDGLEEIGDYSFRSCKGLTNVYYKGSMEDWSKITIDEIVAFAYITDLTFYYYSETEPLMNSDGTAYDGNYWYYDENGALVMWEYKAEE